MRLGTEVLFSRQQRLHPGVPGAGLILAGVCARAFPLIQASRQACRFPTRSQADEFVTVHLGTSLHQSPLCASCVQGAASVWGSLVWKADGAESPCVCQTVLNDAGETGGRSEAGGTEQPAWLCLGLLPRG